MKSVFLPLSLIAAAALVACGKSEPPAPAAPAATAPAPAAAPAAPPSPWPELRVAVDPTYKPFTYKTDSGELAGFDVDVAKALCDELKSKCVFVEQAWDGMIPGLQAKKYDAIISSMSITEERKQAVDFTGKYYNTPSCVVVKSALNLSADAASFKGKKLGVLKASTQEKYAMGELKAAGATIVRMTHRIRFTSTSNPGDWTVPWPMWSKSMVVSSRRRRQRLRLCRWPYSGRVRRQILRFWRRHCRPQGRHRIARCAGCWHQGHPRQRQVEGTVREARAGRGHLGFLNLTSLVATL